MKTRKPKEAESSPPKNEKLAPTERVTPDSSGGMRSGERRAKLKAILRRGLTFVSRALMVAAVVVGAIYLGQALESFVRTSPAFSLESVAVSGTSRLSDADIIDASGLVVGENVFKWPPEDVEARLTAEPWIAKASVKRKLPNRFEIEVREHTPRALLVLDSLFVVSREGVVFKEANPSEDFDLPIITLENADSIRANRERRAALLSEVAALLHDVDAAEPSWSALLSEVHVQDNGAFTLRFGDEGTEVRLGKGDLDGKLARLRRVFDRLAQAGVEASKIYADNERRPDRVTVELR